MKELDTFLIKYPYGFTLDLKSIGTIKKETYFGKSIKVKNTRYKTGTLLKEGRPVLNFEKFKNFDLDIFKFENNYYSLYRLDDTIKLHSFSTNLSKIIDLKLQKFKTNGIDKIVTILDNVIRVGTFKMNDNPDICNSDADSPKYDLPDFIFFDKVDVLKNAKGLWLDIYWNTNTMFDVMFAEAELDILKADIDKYKRHLIKGVIEKDRLNFSKTIFYPKKPKY